MTRHRPMYSPTIRFVINHSGVRMMTAFCPDFLLKLNGHRRAQTIGGFRGKLGGAAGPESHHRSRPMKIRSRRCAVLGRLVSFSWENGRPPRHPVGAGPKLASVSLTKQVFNNLMKALRRLLLLVPPTLVVRHQPVRWWQLTEFSAPVTT